MKIVVIELINMWQHCLYCNDGRPDRVELLCSWLTYIRISLCTAILTKADYLLKWPFSCSPLIVVIKVLSCTLVCFCHLDREVWKITYKISFLLTLSMKVNKLLYVVIYIVLFVLTLLERLYFLFAVLKANKTTKNTAIQDILLYFLLFMLSR